jgi:hypothetical protein
MMYFVSKSLQSQAQPSRDSTLFFLADLFTVESMTRVAIRGG